MEKTQNEGNLTYAITLSVDEQTYVTLNLGYTGLNTDSVTEDINAIITIPETSTSTYSYNKTVAFGQVDIASFDESTIVLNNYSAEQVSALLQQVSMAVVQTNSSLMTQIGFDANEYGTQLLNSMVPNNDFDFPKSLWNVYECLYATTKNKPNAIIVDFFAGSGTTGHAVEMLNKICGGNRTYILATNNVIGEKREKEFKKKFGKPEDYPNEYKDVQIIRN